MKFILIFGREGALSAAEGEALFGPSERSNQVAGLYEHPDPSRLFSRIGGSTRMVEVKHSSAGGHYEKGLIKAILASYPGKDFGLSFFADRLPQSKDVSRLGLELKKEAKASGRNLRFVSPLTGSALSSAQVYKRGLTGKGLEIVVCRIGETYYYGRTISVQDIESYGKRDYGKPCRDMKTGMLPPKLAQIAINLAMGAATGVLYDPFCGTGTVLSEGLLAGMDVYGSDLAPKLTECTLKNLAWLSEEFGTPRLPVSRVFVTDALKANLHIPTGSLDAIVTEGTLGPPLTHEPSAATKAEILTNISFIVRKFLKAGRPLLAQHGRVVFMTPIIGSSIPKIIDALSSLGYTNLRFGGQDYLSYGRPGQIVKRAIFVLERSS